MNGLSVSKLGMIPGAKSAVDIMYSCKKMINDVGSICPLPVTLLSSDSY